VARRLAARLQLGRAGRGGGGTLGAEKLAHTVETVRLGAVHIWLHLVAEAAGLPSAGHRLRRVQAAPQPVADRGEGGDGNQDREEEAHAPVALGRG